MAEKKVTVAEQVKVETSVADKSKAFWVKNSKLVIYGGIALIVLLGGWLGYKKLVLEPKEVKANELVFQAESLFDKMASTGFNKDSVNIALNGGVLEGLKVPGLLSVINNYGGTQAGNRAKYMVGASYLHIGEFDKAIKYLKDFDSNGASQVAIKANELIGHAYAEKKDVNEALNYYKKAAAVNEKDEAFTADALLLAAGYADANNKTEDAITLYKKVKDNFPSSASVMSGEVDKYLARLGVMN